MHKWMPVVVAGAVIFATPVLGQSLRDNLMCYNVKSTNSACDGGANDGAACRRDIDCPGGECVRLPRFVRGITIGLNDILSPGNPQGLDPTSVPGESSTYDVRKVNELCAPAIVGDQPIGDPGGILGTHWLTYQIKQARGFCAGDVGRACGKLDDCISAAVAGPCIEIGRDDGFDRSDPRNLGVRVRDVYSDLFLDFGKENSVMVPASEDVSGFLSVPTGEEFYKCYAVKPTNAMCDGGGNDGGACRNDGDCPGGVCERLPKFPRDTHPDGLSISLIDQFTTLQDPLGDDPEKTFDVRKVNQFCQAVDKKSLHFPEDLRIEEQAGLLCYQARAARRKCISSSPVNPLGSCRGEPECGGLRNITTFCQELDPKFDNKDPNVAGRYVNDDIFFWVGHRLDIAKESMLCSPACRGFGDFELTPLVARVQSLALGSSGHPGNGVDVDGDPNTCAPQGGPGCSGGIDNQLAALAGFLNPLLEEELAAGSINLLFQLDQFANGAATVSGFTGDFDTPAGCATGAGTPADPLDPGNPGDPCTYVGDKSSFFPDVRDTCEEMALITLPVDISGADTAPIADVDGGGPGSSFTLNLPFGDGILVTANNVRVEAEVVHDTAAITEINGVLGGAISHALLVDAVAGLDNVCVGGANDEQPCTTSAQCPGGNCWLAPSIPFDSEGLASVIQFSLPPDIDTGPGGHCVGGGNANEFCADDVNDCPDTGGGTSCAPQESVSLGLVFSATLANVSGLE